MKWLSILVLFTPLLFGCAHKTEMNNPVKVYAPYPYAEEKWTPPSFKKDVEEIESMLSALVGRKKASKKGALLDNLYNESKRGSLWEWE